MTSPVETADRIATSPDCVVREIKGETVLLHLTRGTYYGLDATGTVIWRMLEDGRAARFDAVLAALAARFGKAPGKIAPDIRTFLDDLHAQELIVLEDAA